MRCAEDMADPRFIPYIQLHEFEALLLSEPEAFSLSISRHMREQIESI